MTASPSPRRLRRQQKRRALHDRSESDTNKVTIIVPTIRVVQDQDDKVRVARAGRGWADDRPDVTSVPTAFRATASAAREAPAITGTAPPCEFGGESDEEEGKEESDPDSPNVHVLPFTPPRTKERRPGASSADAPRLHMSAGLHPRRRRDGAGSSQDIFILQDADARLEPLPQAPWNLRRVDTQDSQTSLNDTPRSNATAASSETVVWRREMAANTPPSGIYLLHPPDAARSLPSGRQRSGSGPGRPLSQVSYDDTTPSPTSSRSPVSPVSPATPTHSRSRSLYATDPARSTSDLAIIPGRLPYPVDRDPDAGRGRSPSPDPRTLGRGAHAATLQFPTPSFPRSDPARRTSYMSTIPSTSERTSTENPSLRIVSPAGDGSVARQQPFPSGSQGRVAAAGPTVDVVSDSDRSLPPLPGRSPLRLASQRPQHVLSAAGVHPAPQGPQSEAVAEPPPADTRTSVPDWARIYYSRPRSISYADRPGSLAQFRYPGPVAAPAPAHLRRDSALAGKSHTQGRRPMEVSGLVSARPDLRHASSIYGPPRNRKSSASDWSPHLWRSRQTPKRRTIFVEPSIYSSVSTHRFSRRNAQVVLFALGFLIPLAWMVASVLPLPDAPGAEKGKQRPVQALEELEKNLALADARFVNARWWRGVNRVLAVLGVGIMVGVIVIAATVPRRG